MDLITDIKQEARFDVGGEGERPFMSPRHELGPEEVGVRRIARVVLYRNG
jgi:hypothetical protein